MVGCVGWSLSMLVGVSMEFALWELLSVSKDVPGDKSSGVTVVTVLVVRVGI